MCVVWYVYVVGCVCMLCVCPQSRKGVSDLLTLKLQEVVSHLT